MTLRISWLGHAHHSPSMPQSSRFLYREELVIKAVSCNYGKPSLLLSEDDEDTKRVVQSTKDKGFEELTNLTPTLSNVMKIQGVTKCLEDFELLGKAYGKAKSIVDKEGVPISISAAWLIRRTILMSFGKIRKKRGT